MMEIYFITFLSIMMILAPLPFLAAFLPDIKNNRLLLHKFTAFIIVLICLSTSLVGMSLFYEIMFYNPPPKYPF